MNPPNQNILPAWVAPICCIAPFFALVGFSLVGFWGMPANAAGLIGLVVLCGKTTRWVLQGIDNAPN